MNMNNDRERQLREDITNIIKRRLRYENEAAMAALEDSPIDWTRYAYHRGRAFAYEDALKYDLAFIQDKVAEVKRLRDMRQREAQAATVDLVEIYNRAAADLADEVLEEYFNGGGGTLMAKVHEYEQAES